ncbi:hypothetical protein ACJX0J_024458, partial [Zea mays]
RTRHVSERACSCAGCTGDGAARYNTVKHQQTIFALVCASRILLSGFTVHSRNARIRI